MPEPCDAKRCRKPAAVGYQWHNGRWYRLCDYHNNIFHNMPDTNLEENIRKVVK